MQTMRLKQLDDTCDQCLAAHVAELKEANRKLEDFVHIASHDLRAPLRAVMSLVEWVRDDLETAFGPLPGNIDADLSELSAQAQRMSKLLQDLLEFTQVASTGEAVEAFDQRAEIEDCIEICAVPARLSVTLGAEFPDVQCSRTEFTVVLRNLISNSIKYHDRPDGRIEIEGWTQDGFGHFRVRDDGPGVAAEYAEQIFEMFRTLDSSRGSGIGLGMVKKISEKYGGGAKVLPNPQGRGSDFIVSFPLNDRPGACAARTAPRRPPKPAKDTSRNGVAR